AARRGAVIQHLAQLADHPARQVEQNEGRRGRQGVQQQVAIVVVADVEKAAADAGVLPRQQRAAGIPQAVMLEQLPDVAVGVVGGHRVAFAAQHVHQRPGEGGFPRPALLTAHENRAPVQATALPLFK
ncbi:hypothetical protein RZS08_16340, partial [Arthrospira platensis SPKY1]|nr:hypothetical protein [Arthrospira platensis SPKY1]